VSETEVISWQFVSRRLDAVQADTADIRRRMTRLEDRFTGLEDRFSGLERRMDTLERGLTTLETRMDALVERQSKLEITAARTLFLLQRLALKVGGIEDET
jgi:predicted  nucleic acid-binding Zn-ribbon protein